MRKVIVEGGTLLLWALLAVALPLAALTLNAINIAGFPLGFWVGAQGVVIGLAALAWLRTRSREPSGLDGGWTGAAAFAGEMSFATVLVGLPGLVALMGYDALAMTIGLAGGLALLAMVVAPRFATSGARTVPAFFGERLDSPLAYWVAVAVMAVVAVLIIAAELSMAAHAVMAATGVHAGLAITVLAGMLVAVALAREIVFSGRHFAAAAFMSLVLALIAIAFGLANGHGGGTFPYVGFGQAAHDLSTLEQSMIMTKLADPRYLKLVTTPFLQLDIFSFAGVVIGVAFGVAALPHLLARHAWGRAPGRKIAWGSALFLLVLLLLPALGVYARLDVATALSSGIGTTALPLSLTPAADRPDIEVCGIRGADQTLVTEACKKAAGNKGVLRLHDVVISAETYLMRSTEIGGLDRGAGLLIAAVVILAGFVAGSAILGGTGGAVSPLILVKLLVFAVLAGLAAVLAATNVIDAPSLLAAGLVLAGSSLFVPLVLGLAWPRLTGFGATIAMIAGAGIALGYVLGIKLAPVTFAHFAEPLSNASASAIRRLADLRAALAAATDPSAQAALCLQVERQALLVANWWGIKPMSAAIFAVPVSLLAAVFGSLITRR